MEGSSQNKGQMMKVLHLTWDEGGTFQTKLDSEAIAGIVKDKKVQKLPLLIVSINGRKRTGKSFMINLMISYLMHMEKKPKEDDNWLGTNPEITGVEWKKGRGNVTTGIWMSNRPYIIKTESKKKIAVLLMDCQGLFDMTKNSETVDALVTLCGLEMSKIHLLNVKGDIDASDFSQLKNCISYAGAEDVKPLFNTLIILHRDWPDDDDLGHGGNYFMKIKRGRTLHETERIVSEAFPDCIEYMLPTPGPKVRNGSVNQELNLKDFLAESDTEEFLNRVEQLFKLLFTKLTADETHFICCEDFLGRVKHLKQCIETGPREQFESHADLMERKRVLDIYEKLEEYYLNQYDADICVAKYEKVTEIAEDVVVYAKAAGELLAILKRGSHTVTDVGTATWGIAEQKMKERFENLYNKNMEEFCTRQRIKKGLIIGGAAVGTAVVGGLTAGIGLVVAGPALAAEAAVAIIALATVNSGAVSAIGMAIREALKESEESVASQFTLENVDISLESQEEQRTQD